MIRLGEKQELVIVKKVDFGVYLAVSFEDAAEHILLPVKQVPEATRVAMLLPTSNVGSASSHPSTPVPAMAASSAARSPANASTRCCHFSRRAEPRPPASR